MLEENRLLLNKFCTWLSTQYVNTDEDEWSNGIDFKNSKEVVIEFIEKYSLKVNIERLKQLGIDECIN
jgi:hypothetical protein